jgi:hypothetical protein
MNAMEFMNDEYFSWDVTYFLNGWLFSVVGAGAGEASPGRAGAGLDITGGGLAGADGATASGTGLA